jgi:hypothetical protein
MEEFRCLRCDEVFVLPEPQWGRVIHLVREDGSECGGQGKSVASWGTLEGARNRFLEELFRKERG